MNSSLPFVTNMLIIFSEEFARNDRGLQMPDEPPLSPPSAEALKKQDQSCRARKVEYRTKSSLGKKKKKQVKTQKEPTEKESKGKSKQEGSSRKTSYEKTYLDIAT